MKGFFIVVIVAAVFATTLGLSPKEDDGVRIPDCSKPDSIGKSYPNADDCSSYFRCLDDGIVSFYCPSGLWFNSVLEICDWPESISNCCCVPPPTAVPRETANPIE